MVLKGVFPNDMGVLAMREPYQGLAIQLGQFWLCQEENEVLLSSSQTSSYLTLNPLAPTTVGARINP